MLFHPLVVVPVQTFVAPIHSFEVVVGHVPAESDARDHEMICAQQFGHAIRDVGVQSADRRAHNHDRGHADDDSDQSQKRAQFMRQDGLQRDPGRVGVNSIEVAHGFAVGQIRLRRDNSKKLECLDEQFRGGVPSKRRSRQVIY